MLPPLHSGMNAGASAGAATLPWGLVIQHFEPEPWPGRLRPLELGGSAAASSPACLMNFGEESGAGRFRSPGNGLKNKLYSKVVPEFLQ